MRVLGLIFIVLAACGISNANDAEYVPSVFGMQGLRLFPDTSNKVDLLVRNEGKPGLDFLKMPRAEYDAFEVLVAPEQLSSFKSLMEYNNIQYEVFVDDVSKVLKMQEAQQKVMRSFNAGTVSPNNRRFLRYSEMKAYMESLAETRSDIVTLFNMGKSFEGRDLIGVKFSKGGQNKPALFIDAGIHAREWMAPSTAIYIIKQLAEDPNSADIFDNIDIYVLPSLNPDGYEYTQKSFVNRMWRKTRSRSGNSRCVGVDANRNFGMMWNTVGASDDPCSDIYAGPEAFSEPEAKALRDFLESVRGTVKVYLSFHSYGQYLLHPWGFTSKLPENEPALRCAAEKAEAALAKVRGTRYQIGSSTNTLYAAAGGSDDWAMGKAGIDLAYTVELPGGRYGFAPPPSDIIPVGRETFEAVKVFAKYAEGKICQ